MSSSLLSDDRDIARMQVDAVNGVDGAFLVRNVLAAAECDALVALSEKVHSDRSNHRLCRAPLSDAHSSLSPARLHFWRDDRRGSGQRPTQRRGALGAAA